VQPRKKRERVQFLLYVNSLAAMEGKEQQTLPQ
jgi:hypothetical protein